MNDQNSNYSTSNDLRGSGQDNTNSSLKVLGLALLAIVLISILVGFFLSRDSEDQATGDLSGNETSYLSVKNEVLCARVEPAALQCEDLQNGEVQDLVLPNAYQEASSISPSPDASRLLIDTGDGVVVTDANFNSETTIAEAATTNGRPPQFAWSDDSQSVLISEIKREENDDASLPEPLVVSIFDIESGESRRVYKTGESADVESIRVLGSNGDYVFIALPATKNWVAESTDPPADIINAVRISDGQVRPVNPGDININISHYANDQFIFASQEGADDKLILAKLEDGQAGLTLSKILERSISSDHQVVLPPVHTSKGILVQHVNDGPISYSLMGDDGTMSDVNLTIERNNTPLYSLSEMPTLTQRP